MAVVAGFGKILRPVGSDAFLGGLKLDIAFFHLMRQIVFNEVFLFEVALWKFGSRRTAFRPDIVESIGSAQFQRNEVVELAGLILTAVMAGMFDAIPCVRL